MGLDGETDGIMAIIGVDIALLTILILIRTVHIIQIIMACKGMVLQDGGIFMVMV